jgi:UDP-N-acetylglucosamine 2-epimerase (non-hydrolysing)
MDEGTLIMSGLRWDRIIQSIDIMTTNNNSGESKIKIVSDYDTNNVSKKVLHIIMSYTDYINRTVWYK